MAKFAIEDLSFLNELETQQSAINGGASAGAAAAANYNDALAGAASTSDGNVNASARGGYFNSGYGYYGDYYSYSSGPSVSVNAYDRYRYYY